MTSTFVFVTTPASGLDNNSLTMLSNMTFAGLSRLTTL